ncbi:MAG: cyclic pyranopterin monophosphate synthase MoaC [Lachnospiraceae bacterium]|nr:cyclic pyranopterin monophosphate synthase MoaC [Lachnospiraceae bacterium]
MNELTHIDKSGNAVMVDVTDKEVTYRSATASGRIHMNPEAIQAVYDGRMPKGDVLSTARIAGIMAAKRTSDLIPLCHPLQLTKVGIEFDVFPAEGSIRCECKVKLSGRTGAEMEALTGVSTALLTVYDMCKAVDRTMVISDIRLEEKEGGRSGHYIREERTGKEMLPDDSLIKKKTHNDIKKDEKKELNIGW